MSSKHVIVGVAAAALLSWSASAFAQSGPTLDDLRAPGEPSGSYRVPPPPPSYGADPAADLADEARRGAVAAAPEYVDPATVERIENQMLGNYTPIDRALGMPLGTTQDAWSDPFENMAQGQVAPGVVRFRWSKELTMPIRMREFMNTMIILPEWETVQDVYLGEMMYFEARIVRPNTVAMRVAAAGVDTSLNILGKSGNLYTFYVRAESYNTKELTDMTVFVDAAPVDPGMWFQGAAAPAADGAVPGLHYASASAPVFAPTFAPAFAPAPAVQAAPRAVAGSDTYIPTLDLKFVHRMFEVHAGDRAIAPEYVATDGKWTYFYYGDKAGTVDRPVVYRLVDGVEELVATRTIGTKGETIVAEAVGEFVLRNGQRTVCIRLADAIDAAGR